MNATSIKMLITAELSVLFVFIACKRNLTAPYMHHGCFTSLKQVAEHYSTGVQNHPNLAQQLKLPNGQPRLLNLSPQDKAALVAFLKTLTDINVTTDIKYSNPFK